MSSCIIKNSCPINVRIVENGEYIVARLNFNNKNKCYRKVNIDFSANISTIFQPAVNIYIQVYKEILGSNNIKAIGQEYIFTAIITVADIISFFVIDEDLLDEYTIYYVKIKVVDELEIGTAININNSSLRIIATE